MKTFFLATIILSAVLLPICFGQYKKPEDLKSTCSYLAQKHNRFIDTTIDHDTSTRCIFCQYQYNNPSDRIYGGCAGCPNSEGKCTSCVTGYVLFEGKCVSCGDEIQTCSVANTSFKDDKIVQQVLNDITNSSTKTPQEKNIATMEVHEKYLGLRADKCTATTSDGVVIELGHMCKKFENCEKIEKTSNSVSCSRCKVGFYFDQEFKCVSSCKANMVKYTSNYEFDSTSLCSECAYNGTCKSCPQGSVEVTNDQAKSVVANNSSQNLKICQKCMDNCESCSVSDSYSNKIKCSTCKKGFYYNSSSNACESCSITLKVSPTEDQKKAMSLVCSGPALEQVNLSASTIKLTDVLNQSVSYSIKTSNNEHFICGNGAIDCELKNGVVEDKECLYGFALKDKKCVECNSLVPNSVLCEYNENFKEYIPTLCTIGSQFDIPYKDSYYLQITLGEVETLMKAGTIKSYSEVPSPSTWCQKNTNQCKIMVPLTQKLQIKLSDEIFQGSCSKCFSDDEIPVQYRKTNKQDFFTYEANQVHKCVRCSDLSNAVECKLVDKAIIPVTCASSYYLDSADNTCKKCDVSCEQCSTSANSCSVCASGKYLTSTNTCEYILESSVQKLENCLKQQEVNNQQSCQTCSENYELVEKSSKIFSCSAKAIEFCDQMVGTECKRCVQKSGDGNQYYLKDNKCVQIPQGCASYSNGSCSTCQYSYKPVPINDTQVCVRCYQEYTDVQSYIQYDCPGKVKNTQLEDDKGIDVGNKSNSISLIFSAISLVLLALF